MGEKLLVFTSKDCVPCHALIKLLKKENINFTEIDVNSKQNNHEVIKCKVRSTPTLVKKDHNDKIINSIAGFQSVREIRTALGI
jgi:glutaredoxin